MTDTANNNFSGFGGENHLSSLWDGLSPHLIARFYEVAKSQDGKTWESMADLGVVKAPLIESNMDMTGQLRPKQGHSCLFIGQRSK